MTKEEAEEAGFEPVVGQMPLQASSRALNEDASDGFVRITADGPTEFVLGAQVIASEASELVAEISPVIEMCSKLDRLYTLSRFPKPLWKQELMHQDRLSTLLTN